MKNLMFRRAVCFALVLIFTVPTIVFSENGTDDALILTDPVDNTYAGRTQSSRLIQQLQFADLPPGAEVRDAIVRSGALEIIRPEAVNFRPNASVTNEEAIAMAVRMLGLSDAARERSVAVATDLPGGVPLNITWSLGYLQTAAAEGLIPSEWPDAAIEAVTTQFSDIYGVEALMVDEPVFNRTANATRQSIAMIFGRVLESVYSDITDAPELGLPIHSFTDWTNISAESAAGANLLLRHNIMRGQTATFFGPNSPVSRLEMAQIIRNFDTFHYSALGLERRMGTVAEVINDQYAETGEWTIWRHIRVRRADGNVDVLQLSQTGSAAPQDGILDAVVLREGFVMGLGGLEIGDRIEYLVHPATGTVRYVYVTSQVVTRTERLRLEIINIDEGRMTFRNDDYVVFTHPMSAGLFGIHPDTDEPFIRMRGNQLFPAAGLPRGSWYDVTLVGSVITAIEFVGDAVQIPEHRGIVVINNPDFGYLTILDADGNERDFTYNPAQLIVHRRQFYDARDTIGGWHEMFPSIHPDPRTVGMANVTVGDIVVFRVADDDPYRIIELFAVENTTTRYGRVLQFVDQGGYFDMLLEFENGRTAWHRFVQGILVTNRGVPSLPNVIQPGDWMRITVNQHLIAPGVMEESVREIAIDGGGHHISDIVSGNIAGVDAAQNLLEISNSQLLTPAGWREHRPLSGYSTSGSNVRYFHNGSPVTLAHINRYLVRDPNAVAYIAIEDHFAGPRAVHVNVLGGNRLTRYGTILSAGNNQFSMLEVPGNIQVNPATIVVRNGRLVGPEHINAAEWARVSLVGNTAAVVDIGSAPDTSGVQLVRGRISRVMPFESFRVETMSLFDGFRWNFTPIAREFTIDHNTLFINSGGVTSIDNFLGYTDASVIGSTFLVAVEGGRAARVIDAPHTEPIPQIAGAPGHLTVRGIIYEISGNTVRLRDMTVYYARTGAWNRFSNINPTGSITLQANSVIVDRNEIIPASGLRVGQQIMAFNNQRRDEFTMEPGLSATAYIVLVEN
ncbi:MAG: S-layer homology domain-containing protein [Defluviitaleaceae bacterium]|nr:S-layer homology domain-containing protein [Defluviitaleaceae bacterium]